MGATTTGTTWRRPNNGACRAADRWNLWRRVCLRVTKFSDDLDNGALTALRGHTGRREKINSLFLVQRADHDLKLRIRKHACYTENRRRNAGHLPETGQQKRVERAGADCEIAAPVSGRDRILSDGNSVTIERKIRLVNRHAVTRCSTGTENFSVRGKRAQQPIESEFLEIILVDLNKFRFDRDLLWATAPGFRSTKASTISRLSWVLRTMRVPLCGQNVALAPP